MGVHVLEEKFALQLVTLFLDFSFFLYHELVGCKTTAILRRFGHSLTWLLLYHVHSPCNWIQRLTRFVGMLWQEIKQVFSEGLYGYFDSLYNYLDVAVLTLYLSSFTLKYVCIWKVKRLL